jgi:hypothetical protein|tara:strand:+ start:1566 stop:3095 length:1530 start_codon:yes stop_codon:yes gene_type:complete
MEIFGFEITRRKDELREIDIEKKSASSFVPPQIDDGTPVIQQSPGGFISGGAYGSYVDMEGNIKNEVQLIRRYRETSLVPECDAAIDDIVNECVVSDTQDRIVALDLQDVDLSESIKKKVQGEFKHILSLMKFNQNSHELFRKWYVDGRIYFHKVVDSKNPNRGIVDIRNVDPLKIKKVRNVEKEKDPKTKIDKIKKVEEFYVFNDKGFDRSGTNEGATIRIAPEAVCYTTSGMLDYTKNIVIGYLHKALKTSNQLAMMEDALVIYRISRAPERRIFYIDVGNLPKAKAEQYLAETMNKYRNKLVYNSDTGEIKDDRRHMSMLEDFWLPRREGGRGTEISTLPGGQNLADIDDIEYFKKKLYRSLNVPISRMESDNGFNMGRASEISRDELKFNKFTKRLQNKFARLFTDILRTQLILKNVVSGDEFDEFKDFIRYDFSTDNHFSELKEQEIFRERLDILSQAENYLGKFFSEKYIAKNVLRMTDDDIEKMAKEIEDEGGNEEDGDMDF